MLARYLILEAVDGIGNNKHATRTVTTTTGATCARASGPPVCVGDVYTITRRFPTIADAASESALSRWNSVWAPPLAMTPSVRGRHAPASTAGHSCCSAGVNQTAPTTFGRHASQASVYREHHTTRERHAHGLGSCACLPSARSAVALVSRRPGRSFPTIPAAVHDGGLHTSTCHQRQR